MPKHAGVRKNTKSLDVVNQHPHCFVAEFDIVQDVPSDPGMDEYCLLLIRYSVAVGVELNLSRIHPECVRLEDGMLDNLRYAHHLLFRLSAHLRAGSLKEL